MPLLHHTIKQAHLALGSPPALLDEKLKVAAEVLRAQESKNVALGFQRPPGPGGSEEEENKRIEQILSEHGAKLDEGEFKRLMEYLRTQEEHRSARNRFFAQAAVSASIVAFVLLLLGLGDVNETMQKALFSLLGTVVGYWLR